MNSFDAVGIVVSAIESLSIEYMLVGSLSSNAYGIPRSTKDADIEVALGEDDFERIVAKIGDDFEVDRQQQFELLTNSTKNVVIHSPTKFEIELFRLSNDDHHQERFSRRIRRKIGELGTEAWIPTAEDVVIQKLRWARRKDLDDVEGVIAVSGSQIDWDYCFRWADKHGTRDLLDQIVNELPDFEIDDQ